MQPINDYEEFLKANRKNFTIEGFPFDINQFENLIDMWTPYDKIPVILKVSYNDLDAFCNRAYNMNYKETYARLSGISEAIMRKAFSNLAKAGNATALSIMAKNIMKLDENNSQNVNLTIINDLKPDDSNNNEED